MSPSPPEQISDPDQQSIPENVFDAATNAFGSEAMTYLDTANFALGGRTPRELLMKKDGPRIVLIEIQTHIGGGPV